MPKQGLVLFAHGARDPRWAEAFEAVAHESVRPGPSCRSASRFSSTCHPT
jgi:sirohydrochlorin cobaltochelatase